LEKFLKDPSMNISQRILALNAAQQAQLFSLIKNNAVLLNQILPEIALINYIATGENITNINDPVVQAYRAWDTGQ
jgi:hypothetical protein